MEYGFALQGWMLRHFRILAIMESAAEPWFEDARVKTCVAILQRCDDEAATNGEPRALRPFFPQIGRNHRRAAGAGRGRPAGGRRTAAPTDFGTPRRTVQDADLRIIVKAQQDLWRDGVRAGAILGDADVAGRRSTQLGTTTGREDGESPPTAMETAEFWHGNGGVPRRQMGPLRPRPGPLLRRSCGASAIGLSRWAKSPTSARGDNERLRRLFHAPRHHRRQCLAAHATDREFRRNAGGAPRKEVESGKLRIVKAGDGSVHPIEAEYLAPEVHSLMEVDRPVVRAADLGPRRVAGGRADAQLQSEIALGLAIPPLRNDGNVSVQKVASPRRCPNGPTCAARSPWYDLTALVRPGIAFWPMAQQYRHIIRRQSRHTNLQSPVF